MISMNRTTSFHDGELLQQRWTCLFQHRICTPLKNAQGVTLYSVMNSPLLAWEVSITIVVTPSRCGVYAPSTERFLFWRLHLKTASSNTWQFKNMIVKLPCMAYGDAPSCETPPKTIMMSCPRKKWWYFSNVSSSYWIHVSISPRVHVW